MSRLDSVTIHGFRSIKKLDGFHPGDITVLIGPNGAGKTNFIEFFRLLRALADETIQVYANEIGPETMFYLGPKRTSTIAARLEFGQNVYEFDLNAKGAGGVFVASERAQYTGGQGIGTLKEIGAAGPESCLKRKQNDPASFPGSTGIGVPGHVYEALSSWTVYHVHDTSLHSPMRGWASVSDNLRLNHDAGNLASILLSLRNQKQQEFDTIRNLVQLAAPFFDDFVLRPQQRGKQEMVRLEWTQKGSQTPFQATVLSDGTIRFLALAVALLQPSPPSVIVIDEPELGLHPFAISLLGGAIRSAASRTQVIISTQSPQLVDEFEAGQIVVVDRKDGQSIFTRLETERLAEWLDEYSLGELWQKNLLGGRPVCD